VRPRELSKPADVWTMRVPHKAGTSIERGNAAEAARFGKGVNGDTEHRCCRQEARRTGCFFSPGNDQAETPALLHVLR
jgi:hypothetical protein